MKSFVVALGTDMNGAIWKGHFGDSYQFVKYRIYASGQIEFIGIVINFEKNIEVKHGVKEKMENINEMLKDCDCIFACTMSKNLTKIAEISKIQPFIITGCHESIDFLLKKFAKILML